MKYVESLNKKIYLYESMSSEFHALIEMDMGDIFKGIKNVSPALTEKAFFVEDITWESSIGHLLSLIKSPLYRKKTNR